MAGAQRISQKMSSTSGWAMYCSRMLSKVWFLGPEDYLDPLGTDGPEEARSRRHAATEPAAIRQALLFAARSTLFLINALGSMWAGLVEMRFEGAPSTSSEGSIGP